jgi:uncharacterized protein YjbI with pentapeptide repeats
MNIKSFDFPPNPDDPKAWSIYWSHVLDRLSHVKIDSNRHKELAKHLSTTTDTSKGMYPFKDFELKREDIEWLLLTHENGRGPIDWSDVFQRWRRGLDLRGANLRQADLSFLPLTCMCGGLAWAELNGITKERFDMARVHLEGADLRYALLDGSDLLGVCLEKANLYYARLERAILSYAHLEWTNLRGACLRDADLSNAHLQNAHLSDAHLEGANLRNAHLERADLSDAHLEGADLSDAHLEGANLYGAYFDSRSQLSNIFLGNKQSGYVFLADVRWNNVNLAVVDWSSVKMLGDEITAHKQNLGLSPLYWERGEKKEMHDACRTGVRANRQLAVALQEQGLNEEAAHFAYRAQKLQRVVLSRQEKSGQYLFSLFLDLLAGYGYRPGRSLFWYLVIIFGFTAAYYALGHIPPLEAFVFSLTSFHGRGFFPGNNIPLGDPRVVLAAFEAAIGLLIEVSVIATFTQRYFGK